MNLRHFSPGDTPHLISLFHKTVHTVCAKDYSQEQLDAWAPVHQNVQQWTQRLEACFTLVAEDEGLITGFGSLTKDGCVDMLFVSSEAQGKNIASVILNRLQAEARRLNLNRIYSDVSLTARGFFMRQGFVIEQEYEKNFNGVIFQNAIMTKLFE